MVHNERTKRKSKNVDSHLLVTPAIFKPGSTVLKAFGFPIKNFGNDKRGVTPAIFKPGSTVLKAFGFPAKFRE